ncbi:hypothetical protein PSN45_001513 [Yamadazyma tenuis]|uniref:N-acetyltransferase domain-containing protein n=1 Tax=Candida tenuis (strain ATCC 10573 / BCRC 21748 / CBS 615 / JCM 9827 / NBRC 10315 / NRRL Y-1498 / VKM Y-70) TaxID=590646 RepID=G3BFI7_CANTC|nr:uncharacterized protein CANTEDRAFT_116755 [Yamadazyma tenuis ATCC 10573]XP_006690444.1 uncharacterized protein CANTEDRAFT_116755 [Yamadazyma tenuis ATCC 10573]EGV61229.1 hypothetical protein CANTEDRAFT_116755 [Yamadazyma tenuis ATCC 10573]EGV61230.1 hypothetical protein CANTEDRAFT_116755 [Yamadazyma tenuis ATCC 10573]WEJ94035.1 hypothetical protein PSN45_001513 [Yamadazyma tenuis]
MTVDSTSYESVKHLPFAGNQFPAVVTEPIMFNLAKNGQPVTLLCINDASQVPPSLMRVLYREFKYIVDEGLTYPHHVTMDYQGFQEYWFHHFVGVLVEGHYASVQELPIEESEQFWDERYLGDFYVKPNYIGRCSHVCNAGFKTHHGKRGLGLGKELGRKYLEVAPQLGYKYSVFNLVFETNKASLKIWDDLGFERIGYVKNAAVLKGHDGFVGAVMFGKDL